MIQKVIDAYDLEREMYRKCIDTDEEIEKGRAKWDSGLWIVPEEDLGCDGEYFSYTQIIRCRDCKHYLKETDNRFALCELTIRRAKADGFCAWAERKDNEKEETNQH